MKTSIKFKHQKIKSPLLIAVIFGVMVIGVSCDKFGIDYRKKWVGVYECELSKHAASGNPITGETYTHDTVYKAIVDVAAIGDSMLHIEERNLLSEWGDYAYGVRHDVKAKTDGSFKIDNSISNTYIDGYFNKNEIYIEYGSLSVNVSVLISYKGNKLRNQ